MTDQRLDSEALAAQGWLAHPRTGRVVILDGAVLHGVIPGRGLPPAVQLDAADGHGPRRITWMVAFWREIRERPFGPDGLPGSSRPLPDTSAPFSTGTRDYTWHQELALDTSTPQVNEAVECGSLRDVRPVPIPLVWTEVGSADKEAAPPTAMPAYNECFQF